MELKNNFFRVVFGIILLVNLICFASAITDLVAFQGNVFDGGVSLSSGNLNISIYDSSVGGNLVYAENFSSAIVDGEYDVMLGQDGDNNAVLDLEYGKLYYLDMEVNGEDFDYGVDERQVFQAGTGNISLDDLDFSDGENITLGSGWFRGRFNWTVLTDWFSFNGVTLSFNETKLNWTISDFGMAIGFNSTYNATYDKWAYNQTEDTFTLYNSTWDNRALLSSDYVPYTGATSGLDLGSQTFSVNGTSLFDGGWQQGGVTINDGDIFAQRLYVYNVTSLAVTHMNINGSLLPQFDDEFDIGSDTKRYKDLYLSGDANVSGNMKVYGEVSADNITIGDPFTFYEDGGSMKISNTTDDFVEIEADGDVVFSGTGRLNNTISLVSSGLNYLGPTTIGNTTTNWVLTINDVLGGDYPTLNVNNGLNGYGILYDGLIVYDDSDDDESLFAFFNNGGSNGGIFSYNSSTSTFYIKDGIPSGTEKKHLDVDGNISADYFIGDGSYLTGLSGDNSSWNESYADTLYAGSEWGYNQTYSGSTYNITYDTWAYNQTEDTFTLYNSTWDNRALLSSNYVPYTGATGNVDLDIYNLTASVFTADGYLANSDTYISLNSTSSYFPDGNGSRMMWVPDKYAFRAGRIQSGGLFGGDDTQWNSTNIGLYSFAAGFNSKAFGESSVALGGFSKAIGDYSVSLGFSSYSGVGDSGGGSIAIGNYANASDYYAVAIGGNSKSAGRNSLALGDADALSDKSIAIGNLVQAGSAPGLGDYATAIGYNAIASGQYSTALGVNVNASHSNSVVLGALTGECNSSSTNSVNTCGVFYMKNLGSEITLERSNLYYNSSTGRVQEIGCYPGYHKLGNLGCISNTTFEPSGVNAASETCYDTFGGRVPSTTELKLASANLDLQNLTGLYEWTSDVVAGNCLRMNSTAALLESTVSTTCSDPHYYRCIY